MRYEWVWALGLGLLGFAAAADTQNCRGSIPASASDDRFQDNGNGTITDWSTGLIWKQCVEGLSGENCAIGNPSQLSWRAGLQQATITIFAGSSDWRLPNIKELDSLVEVRCVDPAINTRFFLNTPSGHHWSSSPSGAYFVDVYYIQFSNGYISRGDEGGGKYVRLVRDGQ